MTNVARHVRAKAAMVPLSPEADAVRLVIKDDGRGVPGRRSAAGRGGLGLVDMRKRVAMAGGTLAIASRAGRGTTVRVRIPVRRPRRKPVR
jgi:signal transduction histidine kinase